MRNLILVFLVATLTGCQDTSKEMITNLNGYWTIDLVEKPDGSTKEFPFTNHMDFFDVDGTKGTKSRVSPTYDGTFISYGEAITFALVESENQVFLNFRDGDNAYTQILRKATKEELELVHEDGTVYYYKSYVPNAK